MLPKDPFHIRARAHIVRSAQTCDALCRQWRLYDRVLPAAFLSGILGFLLYMVTIAAPLNFPSGTFIKVPKDTPIATVAQTLKDKNLIHSVYLFRFSARLFGAQGTLMAGEYFFPGPQNVFTIGRRLARGDYQLVPVRVTFPEGYTVLQMARVLEEKIADFDTQGFIEAAKAKEGYLFPDTYFFLPGQDPVSVIATLESNFKQKVSSPQVAQAIQQFGKPLSDIVVMASLLEREAAKFQDRRLIAGVLWKRISIGMPLQVDAVFPYIIGKNTFELTHADLKTPSPYNTYVHKGLPPGPIANPSIEAILAAATPIPTNYIYYLSDRTGAFHFCTTYACQLANQKRYLK